MHRLIGPGRVRSKRRPPLSDCSRLFCRFARPVWPFIFGLEEGDGYFVTKARRAMPSYRSWLTVASHTAVLFERDPSSPKRSRMPVTGDAPIECAHAGESPPPKRKVAAGVSKSFCISSIAREAELKVILDALEQEAGGRRLRRLNGRGGHRETRP